MSLFPEYDVHSNNSLSINDIEGLRYIEKFISLEEHNQLWEAINKEKWRTDLKRRVQHYGYVYDYQSRNIKQDMYLGPLPDWCLPYAKRLVEQKLFADLPDQVIVNEYMPGQGIADHIDCLPCFTDTIISLSLGSQCIMNITNDVDKNKKLELLLQPRSLVVLTNKSRYEWTHGIKPKKSDIINGVNVPRTLRISLTFRKVILGK